jgi:hypothetical protein
MTRMLSGADLAREMQVSRQRVGQWLSSGKLAGCYSGEGLARRFDLAKVSAALGRELHPGQMMGNGALTRQAIKTLVAVPIEDDDDAPLPLTQKAPRDGGQLDGRDPDRYEMARTQKAEEEARRLRRMNAEAEGTYVLAAEVERQVARMLSQEIAEFEAVLRDGSRRVADKLGVDFKATRQILMDQWRQHRATRTTSLESRAVDAEASDDERVGDI